MLSDVAKGVAQVHSFPQPFFIGTRYGPRAKWDEFVERRLQVPVPSFRRVWYVCRQHSIRLEEQLTQAIKLHVIPSFLSGAHFPIHLLDERIKNAVGPITEISRAEQFQKSEFTAAHHIDGRGSPWYTSFELSF